MGISVFHLDIEKGWRGGQVQLLGLIEELGKSGGQINCFLLHHHRNETWKKSRVLSQNAKFSYHGWHQIFSIVRFIKKNNITIIHAHSSRSQDIALALSFILPGLKTVVSRKVDFHRGKGWYNRYKYITPKVSLWIAVSHGVKSVLVADGVASEKIAVVHDGIRVSRWQKPADKMVVERLKQKLSIDKNSIVFGIVAALVDHKDHRTLFHAFKQVVEKLPRARLVVVGDGELSEELLVLREKLGLEKTLFMVGFQSEIEPYFSLFDIFVLSSHMEGLGSSLIDAMACGLPVVATEAGGIPELVIDKENGVLVPIRDSDALAQAMVLVAGNEKLKKKFSRNNIIRAKEFDVSVMAGKTRDLYLGLSG